MRRYFVKKEPINPVPLDKVFTYEPVNVIADWINYRFYHDCDYGDESVWDAKHLLHRLEDFGFEIRKK